MREYYEHKGIRINSSVLYSALSNRVAKQLVGVATNSICMMLHNSNLLPHFYLGSGGMTTFMYLHKRTPMKA